MSSTHIQSLANLYFKQGSEVEISGHGEGFLGSWFVGKIITVLPKSSSALVEYRKLKDEKNEKIPLRETIDLIDLRPPPPVQERRNFAIDDDVDAYYHYGWWEGIITGFIEKENKYVVFFRHTREQMAFKAHKLRIHREWVYGTWHPALGITQDSDNHEVPVKSPSVEVLVESPKAEEPVKSPSVKVLVDSPTSEEPVKFPTAEVLVESPKAEKPVKSPKAVVRASKKRKIQPRDDLSTQPKDIPLPTEMQDVPSPDEMQDVPSPDEMQDVLPSPDEMQDVLSLDEMQEVPVLSEYTPNKHGLLNGQTVEVCTDEEGLKGAWYSATLLEILNANKYRIEYKILKNDDETSLIEEVDSLHIRPCPPEVSIVDRFDTHEEVDALYNDGWWVGKIIKVLKDDKYKVYFSSTDEEEKFTHSKLRVHQEWINGKWVIPNKAVEL